MIALVSNNTNHLPHVIDVFGNIKGRDQPIMRLTQAVDMVSLLDSGVFTSDEYVFFDPFCKSGEILLASVLVSLQHKLKQNLIKLNTDKIHREMFESNKYFAMAPDERHYRLSLRTFYGNEKSHNPNFTQNIKNANYLSELDGKLNENKFNKELEIMINYIKDTSRNKKIIAIGNPPYQEDTQGYGKQARPIYNLLIETIMKKVDQFLLVIPARWFSGGMGLDHFRRKFIKSRKIKYIKFFENSAHVFPTVDIRGGVCYLLYDHKQNNQKTIFEVDSTKHKAFTDKYDIIVPREIDHKIIEKICKKANKFLSEIVWPLDAFDLPSNYFDKQSNRLKITEDKSDIIECFSKFKKIYKIPISSISKNKDKINEYKIAFPKAVGGGKGQRDKVLPKPDHFFIMKPGQVSTFSYGIAGSFKNLQIAQNFMSFLQTDFARFLLGLRKLTQDMSQKNFQWIPQMAWNKKWTDQDLFKHFNINEEEKKHIKERVKQLTA